MNNKVLIALTVLLASGTLAGNLSGCTGRVNTNASAMSDVRGINPGDAPAIVRAERGATDGGATTGGQTGSALEGVGTGVALDMKAETVISTECLEAWRKALKGDEKGAMSQLKSLEKRYPKVSTIQMMMGQCLEHLGKREEALKYYRASLEESQFSSIRVFKLAEALRKSGKYEEAKQHYERLMRTHPGFPSAKIGLAVCLKAEKNVEAADKQLSETVKLASDLLKSQKPEERADGERILKEVLDADPDNAEARQLLRR